MDGWNTTFLLGRSIFRGELLVLGRVPKMEGLGVLNLIFLGCFGWETSLKLQLFFNLYRSVAPFLVPKMFGEIRV